jgi:RNA polymerase sigma-B factor
MSVQDRDGGGCAGPRGRRGTEDVRLARRHRGGDRRAREILIARYLPLARNLASRYRGTPEPFDDLVQVAALALVKAVDRWDPDRGLAFSSYAVPTILGELRRYFRDVTWAVRPPRALQELCLAVELARAELSSANGREPTVADLAERVGRPLEEVLEALYATAGRSAHSLDAPVNKGEDDTATAVDLIGWDDLGYDQAEDRATVEHLTSVLDARAREILRLRFAEDLLQSEIAERVGCSQMHVSRILRSSLERLHLRYGAQSR